MASYRIKPTKSAAVFTSVFGLVIIVVGVTQTHSSAHPWFLVLWVALGLAIIGFNLWSAFSRHGGQRLIGQTVVRDDEPDPPT